MDPFMTPQPQMPDGPDGPPPVGGEPFGAFDPSMMPSGPPPAPPSDPVPENPFANVVEMLRLYAMENGIEAAQQVYFLLPPTVMKGIELGVQGNYEDGAFLESLQPPAKPPVYPPWFQIPHKPKLEDIKAIIAADETEWRRTRERISDDLDWLNGEVSEVPKGFDKKRDIPFRSSAMADEARAVSAMLGTITPNYEIPYTKSDQELATQQAENALYYWDEQADQVALQNGTGDYGIAAASYLVYTGYAVTRIRFDPENPENPFQEQFINPATVAPVWDDRGLMRVSRRYVDTVANVIADFDDSKGSVRRKLMRKQKGKDGEDRLNQRILVQIYHDRWWTCVVADDIEVVPISAHQYGFVPYCVQPSGNGEPVAITSLTDAHAPGVSGVATARERWEKKNLSWFGFRKPYHKQYEEIMTMVLSVFQRVVNPSLVLKQSPFAEVEGDPEIHTEPGGITKLNDQEELGPLVENPSALSAFSPLINAIQQDAATNRLSPTFFGLAQSTQMSGNAMETEYEAGRDKVATFLVALESFYAQRASMRLRMYRDWGHLIQNDDGDFGKTIIPYDPEKAHLRQEKWFELTPGTLDRSGVRAKAICTHTRLQNLAALGSAASIWMQFGGMSAFDAMKMRGVRDPHAVMEQRRWEKAMLDESVEKALTFSELVARDPNAATMYRDLILGGGSPEQAAPMGGMPMGGPQTSAMNLESIGMGNGGVGRPPGPMGPGPNGLPMTESPFGP